MFELLNTNNPRANTVSQIHSETSIVNEIEKCTN